MREFYTVDLFCGAGGASTGLELALARLKMRHKGLAINHWSVAVDTMKRNHPDIDTKQMTPLVIDMSHPGDVVIDPVAGSGSTLRAAAEIGRRSFGFEIKKEFYEKAKSVMLGCFQPMFCFDGEVG